MNNPYTPSLKKLFYGREKCIRQLLADEQAGQSVVLIGGRRCGKTSVLERLSRYLLQAATPHSDLAKTWQLTVPDFKEPAPLNSLSHHWPVLINFQGMAIDSLEQFFQHLKETIINSQLPGFLWPQFPVDRPTDASAMEEWLKEVDAGLAGKNLGGLALLVDEIEELFNQPWHHHALAFLRRLDDYTLKTRGCLVVAGSDTLEHYRDISDGSPAFNTFQRIYLTGLDYPARKRMVQEPFVQAGRLPLTDDVLRQVDGYAAGNVWILTLLLEQLFNCSQNEESMVAEAAQMLLDQQRYIFQRWARPITKEGWALYNKVAARGVLGTKFIKGECRDLRQLLEYQGLVQWRFDQNLEMGPELFRDWAEEEGKIQGPFLSRSVIPTEPDHRDYPPGYYRYDVAISYATPQRACAKELADILQHRLGKRVFFDLNLGHELWGMDLALCLPDTYERQAQITVLLISKEYINRYWPMVEARAAVSKAIGEGWQAVLIVSLDGTGLPDVPDSVVYLDMTKGNQTMADVAIELQARLNHREEKR